MKIMSFNLRIDLEVDGLYQYKYRLPFILKFINQEQPDIIGFQEVSEEMLQPLIDHLKAYDYIGLPRQEKDEYNPIFYLKNHTLIESYTHWYGASITSPSIQKNADFPRIYTVGRFMVEDKELTIVNTHFSHVSNEARSESIDTIKNLYQKNYSHTPFVLMGDFNTKPSQGLVASLQDGLTSCWDLFPSTHQLTFHGYTNKTEGEPIDYIFTSKHIDINNVKIHYNANKTIYVSDHYPISIECKFDQKGTISK